MLLVLIVDKVSKKYGRRRSFHLRTTIRAACDQPGISGSSELMPGNSFGQFFRITTAGESHGPGNVVIIDGVPPGLPVSVEDLMVDLNRRRPGQSRLTTQRETN